MPPNHKAGGGVLIHSIVCVFDGSVHGVDREVVVAVIAVVGMWQWLVVAFVVLHSGSGFASGGGACGSSSDGAMPMVFHPFVASE